MRPHTPRLGALRALDQAVELARTRRPAELAAAAAPMLLIGWLTLMLYYAERVEGVRTLRPWFALCLGMAWCLRCLHLARFAARCVQTRLAEYGASEQPAHARTILGAGLWMGTYLWLWSWLLVAAVYVHPLLALPVLPLLSLRVALAPDWLARAAGGEHVGGLHALSAAFHAAHRRRTTAVIAELILLLGSAGLAFNLGAMMTLLLTLSQDIFGLDLALVRTFLSPRNHFATIALVGLAISAVEPVRAALAAVLYSERRLEHEGLRVQALVERAIRPSQQRGALSSIVVLLCAIASSAQAQTQVDGPLPCEARCRQALAHDQRVRSQLDAILAEPAFREFPGDGWTDAAESDRPLDRWLKHLTRESPEPELGPIRTPRAVPRARFFLMGSVSLVTLAVAAWLLASMIPAARREAAGRAPQELPAPRLAQADAQLREALALSAVDLPRALSVLYGAALTGLSHRQLVSLSRTHTNGQYLRALAPGPDHARFDELTRLFESARYGGRAPSPADFERCLRLAESLLDGRP